VHVTVTLELLEQEVVDRGAVDDRTVERLGGVGGEKPAVRAVSPAESEPVRVRWGGGL
jgi:hypothetical protein